MDPEWNLSRFRLHFCCHATSKIEKVEDLEHIASLGFRGEALSSIAAVSQVELITKTPSDISGSRYVIEGGKEIALEELGAPEGTTFLVRNLFYNTPARSKFLKSDMTEANYIHTLMEQLPCRIRRFRLNIFRTNRSNCIHPEITV